MEHLYGKYLFLFKGKKKKKTTDEKKMKNIFNFMQTQNFLVLLDIIVPEALQEITYNNLLAKAKVYFAPSPSTILERFIFQKRLTTGEIIAEFLKDLHKLSEFCNFGGTLKIYRESSQCSVFKTIESKNYQILEI